MISFLPTPTLKNPNLVNSNLPQLDSLGIANLESELLLQTLQGINLVNKPKNSYNFKNIIVGTFVFIIILVWFDYFQTIFYEINTGSVIDSKISSNLMLAFASFSTIMCIIIILALVLF